MRNIFVSIKIFQETQEHLYVYCCYSIVLLTRYYKHIDDTCIRAKIVFLHAVYGMYLLLIPLCKPMHF